MVCRFHKFIFVWHYVGRKFTLNINSVYLIILLYALGLHFISSIATGTFFLMKLWISDLNNFFFLWIQETQSQTRARAQTRTQTRSASDYDQSIYRGEPVFVLLQCCTLVDSIIWLFIFLSSPLHIKHINLFTLHKTISYR